MGFQPDTAVPRKLTRSTWERMVERRLQELELELGKLSDTEDYYRTDAANFVKAMVGEHFRMPAAILERKSNERQIVMPRFIAFYLLYTEYALSYPQIAKFFSGKHHTTVMHGVRRIHDERQIDTELDRLVMKFIAKIHAEDSKGKKESRSVVAVSA